MEMVVLADDDVLEEVVSEDVAIVQMKEISMDWEAFLEKQKITSSEKSS